MAISATGPKKQLDSVFDFTCSSGSLLLNTRKHEGVRGVADAYCNKQGV